MAEILVKLQVSNLVPNQSNAWTRGHIAMISEDGYLSGYGGDVKPPYFCVVRITDMTVDEVKAYLEPSIDMIDPINPILTAIRKWKFDLDDVAIPNPIANALSKGFVSVTKSQVLNFIKRVAP